MGGCRGCCVLKLLFLHWQDRSRIIFYGRLRALRRRRLRGSRAQVGRKRGWIDRREYCALFGFAGKSQKSVNRRLINLPESIVRPLARLPDAGYNDGCVPLISQRAHSFPVPR